MAHLRRATLAVLAAVLLPLILATTANAEAYRYWGYYQFTDGAWAFAQAGPAETVPAEGAVEGWRFAVTDETSTRFPRTGDVFDDVCGAVEPVDGEKRVAVVIDYGTIEDAPEGVEPPEPRGDCAQVPTDATGADVLAAVAEVRTGDGGLNCGLDGYPTTGCGDAVEGAAPAGEEEAVEIALPPAEDDTAGGSTDDATASGDAASDAADDSSGGSTIALVAGIVAILGVALAAFIRMRRSPTG